MASSLPTKKLVQSNYVSWSYKMHEYLPRHGYWRYVEGTNVGAPDLAHKDFPVWGQVASRGLYCLASYSVRKLGKISKNNYPLAPLPQSCSFGKS